MIPRTGLLTVGIDVGGTKVLGGVVDATGRVLDRQRRDTPGKSAKAVEDTIVELVSAFREDHEVGAVGIGAAGFVDGTRAVVLFSPHLAWRKEPLRDAVMSRLRLPVVVDNDANTAAIAECAYGAAVGQRQVICITLGTGIGGALVLDGRVYRGANGMAGEFGHMQVVPDGRRCECGNRGCWEQYASGNALVREAREMILRDSPISHGLRERVGGDVNALTGQLISQAANDGDPTARELMTDVGTWLGTGLAGLTAGLDPSCLVIGGGVSDAGELLLAPARASFARSLPGRGFRTEPPVVQAALGADAGFIGAAVMARTAARRSRRVRGSRRTRVRRTRLLGAERPSDRA